LGISIRRRTHLEVTTIYFEDTEKDNSDEVLRLVRKRAEKLEINKIVISSTTGDTAVKAVKALGGYEVIVVTLATGAREPDDQPFTDENRRVVESQGGKIITTTHAFGGLSNAVRGKYDTVVLGSLMASTLYVMGSGFKVACEVTIMAADSGLARTDEDIIAIGGTRRGINTAIVCKPVNVNRFFDLRVKEILCKPRF